MKRCACALKSAFVSPPVREAPASGVLHGKRRTVSIVITKRNAVIVAEIVFRQIPMQVLFLAMLVHAPHAALEDREIAFR